METTPAVGSISLKPNKPEVYDGKRDFLVVNTWLYKVEQYLVLVQLSNPAAPLTDANRITYASTFLTGTAAVWWYTVVQANLAPTTWDTFKAAVVSEFVPEDHVRRARDKLRKMRQTTSVSKYLSDFRNVVLTIPGITDGEKWDKFCAGLKYEVRLEVMKSAVTDFDEAAKVALRVDSAIWSAFRGQSQKSGGSSSYDVPTPMEIGNVEKSRDRHRKDPRREEDYRNNACFKCHKVGCRPWKHEQNLHMNNFAADQEDAVDNKGEDSDSSEN